MGAVCRGDESTYILSGYILIRSGIATVVVDAWTDTLKNTYLIKFMSLLIYSIFLIHKYFTSGNVYYLLIQAHIVKAVVLLDVYEKIKLNIYCPFIN
jgi:hypothetical protein